MQLSGALEPVRALFDYYMNCYIAFSSIVAGSAPIHTDWLTATVITHSGSPRNMQRSSLIAAFTL